MDALVTYSDSDQDDNDKPQSPPEPAPPPASTSKLPSADALFDGGAAPLLAPIAAGAKRPTPPNTLAARKPPTKLQRGAKQQQPTDALLPPQLKGRSNVVTEDLGRLFTQRRAAKGGSQQGDGK